MVSFAEKSCKTAGKSGMDTQFVRSSAPRRSWLVVLSRNGFPCGTEHETTRVDPVADLIGIGQFVGASREQLLKLTLGLAPTLRSCRDNDVVMVDRGPLAWEPVRLSTDNVFLDTNCLSRQVQRHEE